MKVFGKKVLSRFGAGNAVVIDHGNKWVTLYAHLKKGSIRVRPGDIVKAGQTLGLVGLSGLTGFRTYTFRSRIETGSSMRSSATAHPSVVHRIANQCGVRQH